MQNDPSHNCPKCGEKGKGVKTRTLQSLLKPDDQQRIGTAPYRFCGSMDCDVVYFAEGRDAQIFSKDSVTARVGIKERTSPRPVCYCFGHSVESIEEELRTTGKCTAVDDIKSRMKTACWCETKSPMGSCCLAVVSRSVKAAAEELGAGSSDTKVTDEDCCASADTAPLAGTTRREKVVWAGTVLSAVVASACCWLPLLLVAVGVSGAAIGASFEKYRPLFTVVTFGFLAAAFYFSYRPRTQVVADSGDAVCCPPLGVQAKPLQRLNRAMLWAVTVVAVAFLFFPNYVGLIVDHGSPSILEADKANIVLSIEGMTCEACAVTLKQKLVSVPGVEAVDVNYDQKKAWIFISKSANAPSKFVLLSAVEAVGYKGQLEGAAALD